LVDLEGQFQPSGRQFDPQAVAKGILAAVGALGGVAYSMGGQKKINFPKKKRGKRQKVVHHEEKQMREEKDSERQSESNIKPKVKRNMPKRRYGKRKSGLSKKRKYRRKKSAYGYRKAAFKRAIARAVNRSKNESTVQHWRATTNRLWDSPINAVETRNFVCMDRGDTESIIDKTCPEIDGASITFNDFTQAGNNGTLKVCKGSYIKLWIRNNYQSPCTLHVYHMMCKDFTNTDYDSEYKLKLETLTHSNGVAVGTGEDHLMIGPSDVQSKKWKQITKRKITLNPSEEKWLHFPIPYGYWNQKQVTDIGATTYIKNWTNALFMRQYGHPAHGDAADAQALNVGITDTKVDAVICCNIKYKLTSGTEVKRIETSQTFDAMNNPEQVIENVMEIDNVEQ
jgi:hypothetical protein